MSYSSAMSRAHCVILDVDGTLLLSNDAHARAFVAAMREHGFDVPFERVRPLIGEGSDKVLPHAIGVEKDSAIGKWIAGRKGELFGQLHLPHLQPAPGAQALVAHLRERGLQLVAASSASKSDLGALLQQARVADLLPRRVSADDVAESKPEPDVVQAALRQLGCAAEESVMLGDTRFDVAAARRAGVAVLAVRCGGSSDADLAGAAAIYDDPAHLLRELDRAPMLGG